MKQFRVTVNGKTYDVVVEEINTAATGQPAAAGEEQAAGADAAEVSRTAPKEEKAPAAAGEQQIPAGGTQVNAPMPGVVLRVETGVGQKVKAGDVLLVLEAMKMENEISAPVSGTVREILVGPGTTVNTGDIMVVIE